MQFASGAQTYDKKQMGIHIMVAGLALQVLSLLVLMILCADFARSVFTSPKSKDPMFSTMRSSSKFKAFLWCKFFFSIIHKDQGRYVIKGLGFATLCIFIRSAFRVAELSLGFGRKLANGQVTFMVLEGGMVTTAIIILTVCHTGLTFGRTNWEQASWSIFRKKDKILNEKPDPVPPAASV